MTKEPARRKVTLSNLTVPQNGRPSAAVGPAQDEIPALPGRDTMGQPFVVQMPNRPGELAHLARALCARGINIVQMSGSSAGNLACALVYTDNDRATNEVLRSMGYDFVAGSTLMVEIEDTPCALGDLTIKLADAGVNMKGCCIIGRREGRAEWSLSVDKEDVARKVLGLPALERPKIVAAGH